jgi:arylsulfatase A-like enzyme
MPNDQPNILVLWGDDIGITNLSCYSAGLTGNGAGVGELHHRLDARQAEGRAPQLMTAFDLAACAVGPRHHV